MGENRAIAGAIPDGAAIERQAVGIDADPIGIAITCQYRIAEHQLVST